jgi:hypothetical protein
MGLHGLLQLAPLLSGQIEPQNEWADEPVLLWTHTWGVLGLNLSHDISYPDSFGSFSVSPGTVPQLGHDRFLPDSLQLIFHQSSHHSTLHSLDTESLK